MLQDIVTDAAPASQLLAPCWLLPPPPVDRWNNWVWLAPTVPPLSARLATVSTTSSPAAEVTTTLGVAVLAAVPETLPVGVVWSTPKKFVAPATNSDAALMLMTTLAVPADGSFRIHNSARVLSPPEKVELPNKVRAEPSYVTDVTEAFLDLYAMLTISTPS